MPKFLTNTNIKDTYPGVLHVNGEALPASTQQVVYDGVGNASSLQVGRADVGATVSGVLSASRVISGGLSLPYTTGGVYNLYVTDGAGNTLLLPMSAFLAGIGASLASGTYINPTITVQNGIITSITEKDTEYKGLREFLFTTEGGTQTYTIPANVNKVKFSITGGGGNGGIFTGGAGGSVIGYLKVTAGDIITVIVGKAGGYPDFNANRTNSSYKVSRPQTQGGDTILKLNNVTVATAQGGNQRQITADGESFGWYAAGGLGTATGAQLNGYTIIVGGDGGGDTNDDGREEDRGGSSIWGSSPSYGGGAASHNEALVTYPGTGYALLEW